jgi:hypothetical protein
MRRSIALIATLALAGCGGGDDEAATSTPATTSAPATTAAPTVPTATTPPDAPGAKPPEISLKAPSDGDEYLEGSDALVEFECRNATDCKATVAREGHPGGAIGDGDALPTKPGTYTVVVSASGEGGQSAEASATYTVPDIPGDGGSGGDTQLPPGTPEGGP